MDYADFMSEAEKKKIRLTEQVLLSISRHLSGRKECRGKIYRVAIGVKDPMQAVSRNWPFSADDSIFFDIDIRIKPSRHKGAHKIPVIQHIMFDHFREDVCTGCANGNQVQIYPNSLVPGIYEYRQSASGRYRKWFRLNDIN